jgi:CO dehydrogenase/acetyl-CoA synthase epsilon subunit
MEMMNILGVKTEKELNREIKKLRAELTAMYVEDKMKRDALREETVKLSQELDIPIVVEQRRLLEKYRESKMLKETI